MSHSYHIFSTVQDGLLRVFHYDSIELVGVSHSYYIFSVVQDGLLRVFHYDSMELVGVSRSYFGGLLCAAWSPDGKYIVAGGEDDLVTVYRFDYRYLG